MLEIWRAGGSNTGFSRALAEAVEAEGWDGQMFMDSQSLSADPWVLMGAWALATSKLKLSTGVTNPLTRNLAVTATSAATVHAISGGRAVLGIGRGDSALAYLGHAPVSIAAFERAIGMLQKLLSGESVDFSAINEGERAPSSESLSLGDRPGATRLKWLPEGMPKVELDVAATGPKVIAMSAPVAERVTFSVGAIPERMAWAVEHADAARAAKGLGREGVSYGAQVVVVCNPDEEAALTLATSFVQPLARFQVIQGTAAGPLGEGDTDSLQAIRRNYDMNRHADIAGGNKLVDNTALSPDFVRRFAVVGGPDHCTQRLVELARQGLKRFVIVGPGFYPESWGEARHLFAREVLPALKEQVPA
jgi:5,10-methylenetetrahydromethanopterin reductase